MARPTKLDDLTAKKIVSALEAGVSRRGAANAANVDYATLKRWLASGRAGDEPYCAFCARVEQAEAKAERVVVDALMVAVGKGNVAAITLWLQQRRAADWGVKVTDAANDGSDPVGVDLTADQVQSLADAMRKVG